MASLHQVTGLILSRRDHKEVDRWYSAFTRERGKIEFLARGAHKPLAKLSPHLESFCEADFLLVNGRHYHTIAGVERRRAFPNIHTDLSRLMLAQNGLHLVDIGTKPFESDPFLYKSTLYWLKFLDQAPDISPERAGFLLASFTLKLLALTGYRPELNNCLACKTPVESKSFRWHALKGGVVCQKCVQAHEEQWFAARPMDDDTLKLIRFAISEAYPDQLKPHLSGQTLGAFHEATESLIICHFPTIPANSLRGACLVC